jgi:hypothetical protein
MRGSKSVSGASMEYFAAVTERGRIDPRRYRDKVDPRLVALMKEAFSPASWDAFIAEAQVWKNYFDSERL